MRSLASLGKPTWPHSLPRTGANLKRFWASISPVVKIPLNEMLTKWNVFLDNIVPALDERIEMAQSVHNALKQHVNRTEDNVSKVATGDFQWISDDEKDENDKDLIEIPPDSMFAPKPPVNGVIDVDSVREQLEDFSIGLCTTDKSRAFTETTMS